MYHELVDRLLALSKKYGGKTGHLQQVEFFFYADSEDKGSNLAIELSKLGYDVYGVEKSKDQWSVIGATPLMKIDEATLTKWGEAMYALASELEVLFDGWGMLIEK
jgi:regulator of RNase E activity RraB